MNFRKFTVKAQNARYLWNFIFSILVVLGAFLRFWRIGHGLPDFFEEAMPLRRAFIMWESGEWLNPHFFNYPTLSIYLNEFILAGYSKLGIVLGSLANQEEAWFKMKTDPSTVVLISRSVNILADVFSMLGVWRIARLRGHLATLIALVLVSFSGTMVLQSRLIIVEPIMTAFLIWTLDRLICFQGAGNARNLAQAVVLGGLAIGTKYNAGLVVFPVAYLAVHHFWRRAILWVPVLVGGCLLVFLFTSPYVLLDFKGFYNGFRFEAEHMAMGHLGTVGKSGAFFVVQNIGRDMAYLGIPFLLAWIWNCGKKLGYSFFLDGIVFTLLVPLLISVMAFKMEANRYLVPVIPLAALAVGFQFQAWFDSPGGFPLALRSWQKSLMLVPLVILGMVAGFQTGLSGKESTRILARNWIESNLSPASIMVTEEYGPVLLSDSSKWTILQNKNCKSVRPDIVTSFYERPTFKVLSIPIAVSGSMAVVDPEDGRRRPLFSHVSDFSGCFYDPGVFVGVQYFISSGGVRKRYLEDPTRYTKQVAFYSWLETHGNLERVFSSGGGTSGPEIRIYTLPDQALNPIPVGNEGLPWWGTSIRTELVEAFGQVDGVFQRSQLVKNLNPFFQDKIMPFLIQMARYDFETGEYGLASHNSEQVLEVVPGQRIALALFCRSQLALERPTMALLLVERALAAGEKSGEVTTRGWFLLERANIYRWMGQSDRAISDLGAILSMDVTEPQLRQMAQRMLKSL